MSGMLSVKQTGSFKKTKFSLKKMSKIDYQRLLDTYAKKGVILLAQATPKDSGVTADSWGYEINVTKDETRITWTNSSIDNGLSVVILLMYGHATRNGKFVMGFDFVTPTLIPVFEEMAEAIWKEVTNA